MLTAAMLWGMPALAQTPAAASFGEQYVRAEVDNSVGSFKQSIPIAVPAYHGIEPKLALSYDSNDRSGFVGVGWRLNGASVIERASPQRGSPIFNANDIFLLDGQELVPCTSAAATSPSCSPGAGGTHTTKIESYTRIKRDDTANTWEVTQRNGTKLTYASVGVAEGTTYSAPTLDDNRIGFQFRWVLKTVTDTHGNRVEYKYIKCITDIPYCYLSEINYHFNGTQPGTQILLYWQPRRTDLATKEDIPMPTGTGTNDQTGTINPLGLNASPGIKYIKQRLKTIYVKSRDAQGVLQPVRAYQLQYSADSAGDLKRLTGVKMFGTDVRVDTTGNVTGSTSLPAITLGYAGGTNNFQISNWATNHATFGTAANWFAGDFNGDGKADFARGNAACTIEVELSSGTGFTAQSWAVTAPAGAPGCSVTGTWSWDTGDFNGDGKADLVSYKYETTGPWTAYVYLSSGTGFTATRWANQQGSGGTADKMLTGDFDGDGKTDFFRSRGTSSPCSVNIHLSNGTDAFSLQTRTYTPCLSFTPTTIYWEPTDINGDGKTDLIRRVYLGTTFLSYRLLTQGTNAFSGQYSYAVNSGSATSEKWLTADVNGDKRLDIIKLIVSGTALRPVVFFSTGNTYSGYTWPDIPASSGLIASTYNWRAGDFNGDGLTDLVAFRNSRVASTFTVLTSTGNSFVSQNWGSGTGALDARVADFNGDGKTDLATFWISGTKWNSDVFLANGAIGQLMTSVRNILGGTTTVTYAPASGTSNPGLPFVTQTVASMELNDGRSQPTSIARTTYQYSGAKWDPLERRFLGFGTTTIELPCIDGETEPNCPTKTITFLQSKAAFATPTFIEERDSAGNLLRKAEEQYSVNDSPNNLPYFTRNHTSIRYVYDVVAGTSKSTKVTRRFDGEITNAVNFGNVIEQTSHGDVALPGDELTVATDYAPNPNVFIVGLPGRVRTLAGVGTGGTKLAETQVVYDGKVDYTVPPDLGEPRLTRKWLTGATYVTTTVEFDTAGNVTATQNENQERTEFLYDTTVATARRFVVETRNPLYFTSEPSAPSHKTTATWDYRCAQPAETHDLNNQPTAYQYNPLCWLTQANMPGGGFTITNYNLSLLGTPGSQYVETQRPPADASGNIWSRFYLDGFGRTYRSLAKGPASGQDIRTDTAYDKRGNVLSETAPYYTGVDTSQTTTFKYDAINRRVERRHPDNAIVAAAYGVSTASSAFEKKTVTDELGRPVVIHTDAYGRTVREDRTLSGATVSTDYGYDLLGRLTRLTDDANNQWDYEYDPLGRRTGVSDPDLGIDPNILDGIDGWTYSYDNAGRLVLQVDNLNQRTVLTYDALGRVKTKVTREGTTQAQTTTYTYDEARTGFFNVGHLTTAVNAAETMRYNYDEAGRLRQEIHVVDSVTYTTTTTYDAGWRVTSRQYPDGDSVGSIATPFGYDGAGRLVSVPGLLDNVTYTARDQQALVDRANDTATTYGYSTQRGWLACVNTVQGSTNIQNLVYQRDAKGRISKVTSRQAGESWSYGYDDFDRLLSSANGTATPGALLCDLGTGTLPTSQTFTYDSVGNMLTNQLVGQYSWTYSYPAGGAGVARPHAVTSAGGQSYGYDANGNMISAAGDTLTYDGENRLVSAPGVTFVYGADGNRLKKIVGTTTTLYLGTDVEKTGSQYTKYLAGDALRQASTTYWLLRDHLNSVRLLTGATTGNVVDSGQYRPYGERLGFAGPVDQSRGYIGERHDDETGLMYLNARYYDPVLARFLQPDPSDPRSARVGVNRYAYAGNGPVLYLDPSGLSFGAWCGGCPVDFGGDFPTQWALNNPQQAYQSLSPWSDGAPYWISGTDGSWLLATANNLQIYDSNGHGIACIGGCDGFTRFERVIEAGLGLLDALALKGGGKVAGELLAGAGKSWKAIDEVVDPRSVKQAVEGPAGNCGAACGEMLLADRGVKLDQLRIGTGNLSVQDLARELNKVLPGWAGKGVSNSSFAGLNATGSWAAVMKRFDEPLHMVVVDGVDATGRVIIRDPAEGTSYFMSQYDFMNLWTGFAVYRP